MSITAHVERVLKGIYLIAKSWFLEYVHFTLHWILPNPCPRCVCSSIYTNEKYMSF